jgi:hypothetical protein
MGERAVPIKHLNDESKDKSGEMEDLYNPVLDSPEGTQKEKHDPEKMDHHHTIRKNLVEHVPLNSLSPFARAEDSSCQPSPLERGGKAADAPQPLW